MPASDTKGNERSVCIPAMQFFERSQYQPGTGHPDGMSQSDGAAERVDSRRIRPGLFDPCEHDRGEGFVDFEGVDLIDRQSGPFEELCSRRHDRCEHHDRITARKREMRDGGSWPQAQLRGYGLFHNEHGRGAISHLARVAGRNAPVEVGKPAHHLSVLERRLQGEQPFDRRVAPKSLVAFDQLRDSVGARHRNRNDRSPSQSAIFGRSRFLMGLERETIHLLSADRPSRRDQLRRYALMDQTLGVSSMKGRPFVVPPHAIDARRHETHHLDAAGDHDVVSAGDDPLRGEIQRLLGRLLAAIGGLLRGLLAARLS